MNLYDETTLLNELKSYLNFTWEDSARTERIRGYMLSSISYLNDVAGKEIDLDVDYLARDLLFNRVLYMDSQALNEFQTNYETMLQELFVKYRATTSEDTSI